MAEQGFVVEGAAVDVLSEPTSARGAGRPDARARLRGSKLGTLIVLAVTAAVVIAGAWLVNQGTARDAAAQTGGAAVTRLSGAGAPELGKAAPDFTVTTYDGRTVKLSDLRGKPVWLTFGASWCAGCQAEVPDIQAASVKYAPQGLVVLGINITEDSAAVKTYANRIGLTYPIAADPNSVVADQYAISAIPGHYFIDRQGVIRDIRPGALQPATMDQIITKLVAA